MTEKGWLLMAISPLFLQFEYRCVTLAPRISGLIRNF
jgi:hypothetical protein